MQRIIGLLLLVLSAARPAAAIEVRCLPPPPSESCAPVLIRPMPSATGEMQRLPGCRGAPASFCFLPLLYQSYSAPHYKTK